MLVKKYKTVLGEGKGEIIEKKSKFIATVKSIKNEQEAFNFIELMRKKYYDANHNVYAFVIGSKNEIQRYSDDGEPSGTAGLPVLDVLKGEEVKDTLIVVTRYFGGTLLGKGGLVRAYSQGAKEGLSKSIIIEKILYQKVNIKVDYTISGKLQHYLNENGIHIMETIYLQDVTFVVLIEEDKIDNVINDIVDITNGDGIIDMLNKFYGALVDKEVIIF
ncbi:MAG: YigZ family protein [Eubacteriales bacterium]